MAYRLFHKPASRRSGDADPRDLPWQDWMSIDEKLRYPDAEFERINIPANAHHCWCYRMHLTLEDLMKKKDFNKQIKEMIDEAGRY